MGPMRTGAPDVLIHGSAVSTARKAHLRGHEGQDG